jgi:hypothetical protein
MYKPSTYLVVLLISYRIGVTKVKPNIINQYEVNINLYEIHS